MRKEMSRTCAAGKNLRSNAVGIFINIFFSFFSRKIFVLVLGKEYVGLSSLIGNVAVLLSLFDFGSATALTFSLYKPLSQNDTQKISSYLHCYKKLCRLSAFLTSLSGILLLPHLPKIVPDFDDTKTIAAVFLIYIFSNSVEYFFSAEKILLFADQKNYVSQIFSYTFGAITLVVQGGVLALFANYVAYLLAGAVLCLVQDILLVRHVRKNYPEIDFCQKAKTDKTCKKILFKEMLRLQPSNISQIFSRTIDNFLVVHLFGVAQNGVYSNYNLLLGYAGMLSVTFVGALSASVGNLGAESTKAHSEKIFRLTFISCFFLVNICTTVLFVMSGDIITVWLGKNLVIPALGSALLAICFFISAMRRTTIIFRDSFGLYNHEKIKPFAELLLFVFFSFAFAKNMGICGIYLAQSISALCVFWYEPYVLFKYGFGESPKRYFKNLAFFTACTTLSCFSALSLSRLFPNTLAKITFCLLLPPLFFFALFGNSDDVKNILKRLK